MLPTFFNPRYTINVTARTRLSFHMHVSNHTRVPTFSLSHEHWVLSCSRVAPFNQQFCDNRRSCRVAGSSYPSCVVSGIWRLPAPGERFSPATVCQPEVITSVDRCLDDIPTTPRSIRESFSSLPSRVSPSHKKLGSLIGFKRNG